MLDLFVIYRYRKNGVKVFVESILSEKNGWTICTTKHQRAKSFSKDKAENLAKQLSDNNADGFIYKTQPY